MRRFERETLFDYYGKHFSRSETAWCSAAGNLEHDNFVDNVVSAPLCSISRPRRAQNLSQGLCASGGGITLRNKKALEQVQLCLGVPSPPHGR